MSENPPADILMENALRASQEFRFADAADLLRQAFTADPSLAGGHRAYLADALKRGVDLENIARLGPPRLNTLVHSGWLNSLISAKPVDAQGRPIPWFTHPAIDFLEPKIQPHWNVLEWGCGNSTLWWAARVKGVTSIEHDPTWHRIIAAQAPSNATINLRQDADRYVEVETPHEPFDAIVIDGEHRNRCARRANQLAGENTIIIFDNSDRKTVRDGLLFLTDIGWNRIDFFGLLPAYLYRTCTSLFFKSHSFPAGPLPCDAATSLGPTCAQVLNE